MVNEAILVKLPGVVSNPTGLPKRAVPPLDIWPNAARAYGDRLLRSGYTGKLLRIRRVSDNTEMDIGANAFGLLDTTTAQTFIGSGDAYVTAYYDQSGNNVTVTQTDTTRQAKFATAGVIDPNGASYDGVDDYFSTTTVGLYAANAATVIGVFTPSNPAQTNGYIISESNSGQTGGQYGMRMANPATLMAFALQGASGGNFTPTTPAVLGAGVRAVALGVDTGAAVSIQVNGNAPVSVAGTHAGISGAFPTSVTRMAVGAIVRNGVTLPFKGNIKEVIWWSRAFTADEQAQLVATIQKTYNVTT